VHVDDDHQMYMVRLAILLGSLTWKVPMDSVSRMSTDEETNIHPGGEMVSGTTVH
jgi:hypothetical protein